MPSIGQHVENLSYSQFDYDDATVFAADLGPHVTGSIEVLGDVALLVVEHDGEEHQHELALPAGEEFPNGDARGYINNGVVTVEVNR
ncbi:MAG: hypothetical protein ABEJ42_03915 [Halobacteriaceae archaeon]